MNWLDSLLNAPSPVLYAALFAILVVEGLGLPWVPYEPIFLAAGMAAEAGRMSLPLAALLGAAGNLMGNLAGYYLAAGPGRRLVLRYGKFIGVGPEDLARVEGWFTRYGAAAALAARFIGVIRTPVIVGAGLARMNMIRYAAWSAVGGVIWSFIWLYGSALLGPPALEVFGHWAGVFLILFLMAFPFALWLMGRWNSAQRCRRPQG